MKKTIEKVIEDIKQKIIQEFKSISVTHEYYYETDDYFIIISDWDIFHSKKYIDFTFDLKFNELKEKEIFNVQFICDPGRFKKLVQEESNLSDFWEIDHSVIYTPIIWDNIPISSVSCQINTSENVYMGKIEDEIEEGYEKYFRKIESYNLEPLIKFLITCNYKKIKKGVGA